MSGAPSATPITNTDADGSKGRSCLAAVIGCALGALAGVFLTHPFMYYFMCGGQDCRDGWIGVPFVGPVVIAVCGVVGAIVFWSAPAHRIAPMAAAVLGMGAAWVIWITQTGPPLPHPLPWLLAGAAAGALLVIGARRFGQQRPSD